MGITLKFKSSTSKPSPDTPSPDTPSPDTPSPDTPSPDTPSPDTPSPDTPSFQPLKYLKQLKAKISAGLPHAINKAKSDEGSISLLVIGLFIVTVAILLVITNISAVAVAKRSLVQATEAAAQRGVHNLDLDSYYTGKGTMLSGITGSGNSSVPIDCNKAMSEVADELNYWRSSSNGLKRRELKAIWVTDFSCDGTNLWLSTASRAVLPLQIPFLNISEISIDAHAGAGNFRSKGTYLFGIRIL